MEHTAHKTEKKTQSVGEHCRNTAGLAAKYGKDIGAENIGYLQGLLHDLGKLTKKFDDYINGRSNTRRGEIDHSYAGAKYLYEIADGNKEYEKTIRFIARTIISHHGLNDWIDEKTKDRFIERISKNEDFDEVLKNLDEIAGINEIQELIKRADTEYSSIRSKITNISMSGTEFAFYLGMFERLMQSVLVDADRSDTADFMTGTKSEIIPDVTALWDKMRTAINEKLASFADRTDKISHCRRNISDRCAAFADHEAGICRLIVPTGGGKTLSSLRYAIEYCGKYGMQKIIYTAPFMSILEQNSDVIRPIAGDEFFTEHHSNVLSEIETENELEEYELRTERWDTPVIATTLVQFLNALFSGKMSAVRRMHRLCRSVIIIDEVQSIPLKCVNMFNLAMNFLSEICGCVIVLCSATQPSGLDTPYKLRLDEKASMTGDYSEDFAVFHRTDIISAVTPYGFDYNEAARFCFDRFSEEGNLLVVVNTKSAAKELYSKIKELWGADVTVLHLSTSLCPEHRRDRIKQIKEMLDKEPLICVTTQLIEAGVDISFRCVVRSLAGLDNAAQAAGRCNRSGEAGKVCPVYLIKLKDERLTKLRQIADSQIISSGMIDSGKYDDYQSPETVKDYFSELYNMESKELSYSVKDGDIQTTLIDLLSLNSKRYAVSPRTSGKYSSQAFKTAGSLFHFIDNDTIDVIVPYNDEACELIKLLDSDRYNAFDLRRAQKYTINVYEYEKKYLDENHTVRPLRSGALALDSTAYNNEYGLDINNGNKETIMF